MEQKQVKGSNSTYYHKKKKKEIKTTSKYINLGVNSLFNVDDIAYILSDEEYNSLTNDSKEIKELKQQIDVLTNKCDDLLSSNKNLSDKVTAYENEITSLNQLISSKDKEISDNKINIEKYQQTKEKLEIANKENKELISNVVDRDNYINYLERVQSDYRVLIQYLNLYLEQYQQRNIIKRIANSDIDITKPTLNYIDFKGNLSDNVTAPLIDVPKKEFDSD